MPDHEKIGILAQSLKEQGYGLVLLCGFTEFEEVKIRCFSTVSKNDVYCVLEATAANCSLLPFDLASVIAGDHVVIAPNKVLNEKTKWAAEFLEMEEPLVVACVGQEIFSVFAIGDIPMLTYTAVKMLTTLKQEGGMLLNPFTPSEN